jgi:hypothetical protein
MAWGFILVGALLLVAAWKKKHGELFDLLKDDFTGEGNFVYWVLAIIALIALGTFRPIRPITDGFLGLVVLVIIIAPYRNGRDLFSEFRSQVKEGTS